VVSTNWRDDYHKKFADYEMLGVLEYWIADYLGLGGVRFIGSPKQPTLTICTLVDGEYQMRLFRGGDRIISPLFPDLELTAAQVLLLG
jgi:Uma2 family endonuclease